MNNPDPFAPVTGAAKARTPRTTSASSGGWSIVTPVPPDAPKPPAEHFKLGKATTRSSYLDAQGQVLGYVDRWDIASGKKAFRPLTLWQAETGKRKWSWESWATPRPLYGLDRLAARPAAAVVVTEGERAADAAAELLPDHVAVTSPNGSKAGAKADWSPLKGRAVAIWPDADAEGANYAEQVAKLAAKAGAVSVAIASPPQNVKVGWDAANALSDDGWTTEQAAALVAAATPVEATKPNEDKPRRRGRRHKDDLVAIVLNTPGLELWRDTGGKTYITAPVNGHFEHWQLRSTECRRFVAGINYDRYGTALTGQSIEDVLRVLDVLAYRNGQTYEPCVRVGHVNERIYLDLVDEHWRAVEISAGGWHVVARPPIKFLRAPSMRALPEPEGGELIEGLRRFLNVESEDDYILIVAWLVAALRPGLPFPILILNGVDGSGKTELAKKLKLLIDPDKAEVAAPPKDERDLAIAASNTWVTALDNLSSLYGFLPDALCRLASGGGFRTRQLHSDHAETVLTLRRPVILTGIPSLTTQADLARRSIVVSLGSITPENRQPEEDFNRDWEKARPGIVGALLDAVAGALREIGSVKLERYGSMADFEKWITAASAALGWEDGQFVAAYGRNKTGVDDDTFEGDIFAVALANLITQNYPHPTGWEGTSTDLQIRLDAHTPERIRNGREWPKTAAEVGNRLKRARALLERRGFIINRRRSKNRTIVIVPPKPADQNA